MLYSVELEQQKEEYLPKMAEGDFGAIAITEEKAGSDASAVGLEGRKAWSSLSV